MGADQQLISPVPSPSAGGPRPILYALPVSGYCASVSLILALKGVVHETAAPPGGYASHTYRAIVPAGTIPALIWQGVAISESVAIAELLEERHPQPPLLPADPLSRARQRSLIAWHNGRLEPAVRALFPVVKGVLDTGAPAAMVAAIAAPAERLLAIAGPSGLGLDSDPAPSMLTCFLAPTVGMARQIVEALALPSPLPSPLIDWHTAIAASPICAPVLKAHHDAVAAWLAQWQTATPDPEA